MIENIIKFCESTDNIEKYENQLLFKKHTLEGDVSVLLSKIKNENDSTLDEKIVIKLYGSCSPEKIKCTQLLDEFTIFPREPGFYKLIQLCTDVSFRINTENEKYKNKLLSLILNQ